MGFCPIIEIGNNLSKLITTFKFICLFVSILYYISVAYWILVVYSELGNMH